MISEEKLHKQICDYLKAQYPKVLFNTDMSGIRLSIWQASKAKDLRSDNGFPDITIYQTNKYSNGLFLEVKKDTPFKKNGSLKKMTRYEHIGGFKIAYDHLKRQNEVHKKLRNQGYQACFVWNFDDTKLLIDNYLKK